MIVTDRCCVIVGVFGAAMTGMAFLVHFVGGPITQVSF